MLSDDCVLFCHLSTGSKEAMAGGSAASAVRDVEEKSLNNSIFFQQPRGAFACISSRQQAMSQMVIVKANGIVAS